jgi:hypothetical protein
MGVLSDRGDIPQHDALPFSEVLGPPHLNASAWRCRINNRKDLHFSVRTEAAYRPGFRPEHPGAGIRSRILAKVVYFGPIRGPPQGRRGKQNLAGLTPKFRRKSLAPKPSYRRLGACNSARTWRFAERLRRRSVGGDGNWVAARLSRLRRSQRLQRHYCERRTSGRDIP